MANRDKTFFESEPLALAASGPMRQVIEPVLPSPGNYPSGEELARRLERFISVELNAPELKDERTKRPT